ncbi:MAG: DUF1080 domain-containing protein [Pyrinomonadaceae bacterium]|nr:DUF1080 domain-containing protein [Pyrinomonadaceae bacterium]
MQTQDLHGRGPVMFGIMVALVSCTAFITRAYVANQGPLAEPVIIDPGPVGGPPSDAIVLFDGKELSGWNNVKGGEAKWVVKDGVMTVVPRSGSIATKLEFGNVQLHLEWSTPAEVVSEGQGRGNSGVYLMGRYEVQILDSFNNKTYFGGQAGAIYKQYAPLVNASRAPGQWQTYDIIFHAPTFDEQGSVTKRGRITVLHNGVLVQNNVELMGSTSLRGGAQYDQPEYKPHPPKAPLVLQDHNNPVRFRNIWVRPL